MSKEVRRKLGEMLRELNLTGVVRSYGEAASRAEKEGWGFERFLHHLEVGAGAAAPEAPGACAQGRQATGGQDPGDPEPGLLPVKVRRQMPTLMEGGFVDRGENLLAFGLPGRGKTHLVCALGAELIQQGLHRAFHAGLRPGPAVAGRTRQGLGLERELRRLDAFDAIIIDDIGYVQQTRDETEVLFTLLAERYERRSVVITSNLVFSQWDRIFKDPMTTAAAIDRIIHHCVILELNGTSFRAEAAKGPDATAAESTTA